MELMNIKISGLGKGATRESMLSAYVSSVRAEKLNAWKTAVTVYRTVNHEKFSEFFSSYDVYASEIGYTKSYVSKQVRAVETYVTLVALDEGYKEVSVGFIIELLPLARNIDSELLEDFIQTEGLTPENNRDEVRGKVKHYKAILNGASDTNALNDDSDALNDDSDALNDDSDALNEDVVQCVIIDDEYGTVNIIDREVVQKIFEYMRNLGYSV